MKLAIAIPNSGVIKAQTVNSLLGLVKSLKIPYYTLLQEGSILHAIRENLVKKAIELKCTHLLFIDSDMIFERDSFERLLKRKKDIVGVAYNMRRLPEQKIRWKTITEPNLAKVQLLELETDFMEVEAVPTGFMLIDLKVFKKIPHPWFFWEVNTMGETVTGEDFWFCTRAREAGYKIWLDKSLKIGHLGDMIY